MECKKCNSRSVTKNGFKIIFGEKKQVWKCNSCGHKFNEKINEEYDESTYTDTIEDKSRIIQTRSTEIKTVEDLIKFANIDMDYWEVSKQVVNRWGNTDTNANWQVKAWFRPIDKSEINPNELLEHFKKEASKHSPKVKKIKYKKLKEPCLLELGPVDHHLAQLSWNKETGFGDYDINIARDLYQNAVEYLMSQSLMYNIERILFVAGHDFFNSDTENNTTTKGTVQSEDSRYQKSIYVGCNTVVKAIDFVKQYAPVDVYIVQGNHDLLKSYWMGMFLWAWYRNDENVSVNIDPKLRKYYEYGNTLIGLTHQGKDDRLTQLMPLEAPEAWSRTKYREIHKGHIHHESKKFTQLDTEVSGIKIRTLSTLVAIDAWHYQQGYNSMRQSQGFIHHKEKGNIAEFKFTI